MALNRDDYKRVAAHLAGESTKDEQEHLGDWPENLRDKTAFRDLQLIWENSGVRLQDTEVDADTEWTKLQQAIQMSDRESNVGSGIGVHMLFRIAATLLIITLAGVWLFRKSPNTVEQTPEVNTIAAGDSVETFYLPDSSRIWLNAGSSLSYDETFGTSERRLTLKGEGYFKVSSDQSRPFIIQTETALIKVVGTSFNLREHNDGAWLDVVEGLVRFSSSDSEHNGSIFVKAGETARIENNVPVIRRQAANHVSGQWRIKNNPMFEAEKNLPSNFIHPEFEWRKNAINQTVIQGTLSSDAELASYQNVVLRVAYTNARGRAIENQFRITGLIRPGGKVAFEKRLLDMFRDTRSIDISVVSAEAVVDQ